MLREVITEIKNALGYYRRLNRTLEFTRAYIEENKRLKDENNAPQFHYTAPLGWINDPNGFIHYKGKFHLFYQYNPYGNYWGPMYWGHAVSDDLIRWEHKPVAMAPDTEHDKGGVWSGSAIEKDNKLYLMYSGNIHKGQIQNIAESDDGINFAKYSGNPVISPSNSPKYLSKINIRDPKIWQDNDKYYAVIATMHKGKPAIVKFESQDILNWIYHSCLINFKDKHMRECPDYFNLNDKKVLLMSSKSGESEWIIGREEDNSLIIEESDMLDFGADFYAPQTTEYNNRRIMTAWMQSWNKNIPSREYNYAGMMIIPRELSVINNRLWVEPIRELTNYRTNKAVYNNLELNDKEIVLNDIQGEYLDIIIDASKIDKDKEFNINLMKSNGEHVNLWIDDELIQLSRDKIKRRIKGGDITYLEMGEDKKIRIIIDKYAIEIFSGGRSMSTTAYPLGKDYQVSFYSYTGATIDIEKYDLRR